ncbi:MAG: PQQ-binding-like beta-propeller repeat protein [Candidatus Nealsonbacteria bacterium]|nr:PQQ-binding-like beta-propeller repeat protein [Candidatus Nealsonbacteria bacterium]
MKRRESVICRGPGLLIAATALLSTPTSLPAADWPTYRGDRHRSGATAEKLELPLRLRWTHRSPHAPRPAWPAPARRSYWQNLSHIEPRVVDDVAWQPVAAAGSVYYGSSADDQLRCLDADTGRLRWTFFTDGPVRFAPCVAGGRVYLGSDDGYVYCLDAAKGDLVWKHQVVGVDRRIAGNGRIISAYPVRTGLVVDGGIVYAVAGLYPTQGVRLVALGAADGRVIYKVPLDVSPQGYLLASDELLYVPTGRTNPVAIDRATGRLVRSFQGPGGTYALVVGEELIAGRGNDGTLAVSERRYSGRLLASFQGKQMAVTTRRSYLLDDSALSAIDRVPFMELTRRILAATGEHNTLAKQLKQNPPNGAVLREQIAQLKTQLDQWAVERRACLLWKVPAVGSQSLAVAAGMVFVGGAGSLAAHRTDTGRPIWQTKITGTALALAIANGRLLVSTDRGELLCFAGSGLDIKKAAPPKPPATVSDDQATVLIDRLLNAGAARKGYALVLGAADGRLARQLVDKTELNVVVVDRDAASVARLRERFAAAGLYGCRITAHQLVGPRLPFADCLFNVVIGESALLLQSELPWAATEIQRVTRPCGGVSWTNPDGPPVLRGPLPGAGSWTHLYGNTANTSNSGDRRVGRHLALQWFGPPGPQRMVDRHLRAPAPLCDDGRLIVPGENRLIGVDAYNGTELWDLELPGSQRYSMPYDAGYMSLGGRTLAVAVNKKCWIIDAETGRVVRKIPVPEKPAPEIPVPSPPGSATIHWGYAALVGGRLLGSVQRADASRTKPSRPQIDVDYHSGQPMVVSAELFSIAPTGGRPDWRYRPTGAIINATITVADGCVYFVEARNRATIAAHDKSGRIAAHVMLPSDAYLVALDAATGRPRWQQPLSEHVRRSTNIIFLQYAKGSLILTGSYDDGKRSVYRMEVCDATTGRPRWQAEHANGTEGFGHGEQVHHGVVVGDVLVAEPALYDLATGQRIDPTGAAANWVLHRGGHSCGTMSGGAACLLFRAGNPVLMDLTREKGGRGAIYRLSPSRPGCWINVIAAAGLVLVPEASAGCVCPFSLQTSMALAPVVTTQAPLPPP